MIPVSAVVRLALEQFVQTTYVALVESTDWWIVITHTYMSLIMTMMIGGSFATTVSSKLFTITYN